MVNKMLSELFNILEKIWTARRVLVILGIILFAICFADKILTSLEHITSILKGGNRND